MTVQLGPAQAPAAFAAGLASLQAALERPTRRGLLLSSAPAPKRLAPWAVAVSAEVGGGGEEAGTGRFVVLHDPQGQEGWHGDTRVIALVEAQVEAEMAADPALSEVGWSWLVEALQSRGARYTAAGGTVTRTVSTRFGQLSPNALGAELGEDVSEVEIRASWTALPGPRGLDLGAHLLAWCDLLCSTVGLPPEGTSALRRC